MLIKIYHFLKRRIWFLLNKRKFKHLGKNVIIKKPIYITPSTITISDRVFIHFNARIEGITSHVGVKFSPSIVIGKACTIQQNLHLTCANEVFIGSNTAIAANVTITDINHPYEDITKPIEQQPLEVFSVNIGEDCKIYNNSIILPGTSIGKHCTIGANSVVSGIIPDYSVVVGAPAKIIKRYDFDKKEWRKTDRDGQFIN